MPRLSSKGYPKTVFVTGSSTPFSLPVLLGPDLSYGSVQKSLETELGTRRQLLNLMSLISFELSVHMLSY